MADDVKLDYDAIKTVANQLGTAQEDITAKLKELQGKVDTLVSEQFVTHVAAQSFETAYTEFNAGISKAILGLDEMSKYLNDTVQKFEDIDQSATIRYGS